MVFQGSVDYSHPDRTAQLPFRESCRQGDLARVKELLFHGNATAVTHCLGLRDAVANSHIEVIRFLLEHNVIIDRQVVTAARSPEAFEPLFEHGLDVNQIMGLGLVPLMEVVEKDDEALLRWFLAQGADPNFGPDPDPTNQSNHYSPSAHCHTSGAALETAARYASPAMIDILLEHGAILENSRAINAAMFRETNNADVIVMVEHLLKRGADINQLALSMPGHHWGTRPLCIAAGLGNMELIHWLLERGADPVASNRIGLPPLGFANDWGQDEAEKFFDDLYDKLKSEGKLKDGDL